MRLGPDILKAILKAVRQTSPHEIGCEECFAEMDSFAEIHLAGRDAPEALSLVEVHLRSCRDCREEFEALTLALRSFTERRSWLDYLKR